MRTGSRLLAILAAMVACTAAADFLPKQAYEGETVIAINCLGINPPSGPTEARVSGRTLTLWTPLDRGLGYMTGCGFVHGAFDNLSAGTYEVGIGTDPPGIPFKPLGTLTVQPAPASTPAHTTLSGNWFDPAGPGRGLNIVQGASGRLLVVWLAQGTDPMSSGGGVPNDPGWLVLPSGRWVSPTEFRGHLWRAWGNPVNQPWSSDVISSPAGFATLRFTSATELVFEVQFFGAMQAPPPVTLKRFSF